MSVAENMMLDDSIPNVDRAGCWVACSGWLWRFRGSGLCRVGRAVSLAYNWRNFATERPLQCDFENPSSDSVLVRIVSLSANPASFGRNRAKCASGSFPSRSVTLRYIHSRVYPLERQRIRLVSPIQPRT